ncbi:hypothetical protein GCM10010399_00010 [Dactylosporangium fulvum]|uniref:Integral membrane protein n=1 Tax=Dactylosporangium fulvum TaxID=53359 RepID=A0ABY5VR08_9ACTN|nr:hypothetical protein [Dactylosporangium fulvum]UWP79569.1 hypothetical protein Dfulv_30940 [Dactylosporangium fulvum]
MVSAPSASATADTTPTPGDRSALTALLAVCGVPMMVSALVHRYTRMPEGDEPHYLVINEALKRYGSIHVRQVYDSWAFTAFHPGPLSPHVAAPPHETLPWHGIGGPLLWHVPYLLGGRTGVLLFMVAVSLLTVANVFWLVRGLGLDRRHALLTGVGIGLGSTVLTYTAKAFVEPLAALVVVYGFRVLTKARLRTRDLLLVSAALGALPWVHSRFLPLEFPLVLLLAWRIHRESGLRDRRRWLAFLGPLGVLTVALVTYLRTVWQSFNPSVNQAGDKELLFGANPVKSLVGVLLDQEHGVLFSYPIFLFVLPGVILAVAGGHRTLHLQLLAVVGPYCAILLTSPGWWGGWAPPARLWAAVLPVFAFSIGYALQRARNGLVTAWAAACVLVTMGLDTLCRFSPSNGFSADYGYLVPLRVLEGLTHRSFTGYLPAWHTRAEAPWPFLWWGLAVIAFGLVVLLSARPAARPGPVGGAPSSRTRVAA